MLDFLIFIVAHNMYLVPHYPYLATNNGTQLLLSTHNMWIGGILIVGVAAHVAIFLIRDYDSTTRYNNLSPIIDDSKIVKSILYEIVPRITT
jgi:photosystem I P700 chlorophyll a apoprotein A1